MLGQRELYEKALAFLRRRAFTTGLRPGSGVFRPESAIRAIPAVNIPKKQGAPKRRPPRFFRLNKNRMPS